MNPTTEELVELEGCTDCLMLIANGDTSGTERCQTEEGEAAYLADVKATSGHLYGLTPTSWPYDENHYGDTADGDTVPVGDEDSFRVDPDGSIYQIDWTTEDREGGVDSQARFVNGRWWSEACDVCGSDLGGDRHPMAGWVRN